jgi:hypothetical protein
VVAAAVAVLAPQRRGRPMNQPTARVLLPAPVSVLAVVALPRAAKTGDTAAFGDANARWYANANQIADLISSIDPVGWPDAAMRDVMKVHSTRPSPGVRRAARQLHRERRRLRGDPPAHPRDGGHDQLRRHRALPGSVPALTPTRGAGQRSGTKR